MRRTFEDSEVPFVSDTTNPAPFADLGDRINVRNAEKMLEGWVLEAQVEEWNTVPAGLLAVLAQSRRAVARIIIPPAGQGERRIDFRNRNIPEGWNGTGFLVGRNLLVTNHHVINSVEIGAVAYAEFEYELPPADLLANRPSASPAVMAIRLDPSRLFVTSPARRGDLDYTFIWIEDAAAEAFGHVPMERGSFTVERDDPTFIIHHPRGRLKEVSLDDTEVLRMRSTAIHYAADTDFGSSGAPVFDQNGRLIALHHARNRDAPVRLTDGREVDVVNEGIKIAAIAVDLENKVRSGGAVAVQAQSVLQTIGGSDTLTSFFGGLGRQTPAEATGVDAVVGIYQGSHQDVDVGLWDIGRLDNAESLKAAATAITDLNLDIWRLSGITETVANSLAKTLASQFGEEYDYAMAGCSRDSPEAATTLIWRTQGIRGERLRWPDRIERLWDCDRSAILGSADPGGRLFDEPPGLFKFTKADGRDEAFEFLALPLDLNREAKSGDLGHLRAELVALAVRQAFEADTRDLDWFLGWNVTGGAAGAEVAGLRENGFVPMSAESAHSCGFSYLKGRTSLVDNLYLSPNVSSRSGGDDFCMIVTDRSIEKYAQRVSDRLPTLMRISLRDSAESGRAEELGSLARRIMDRIGSPRRGGEARHRPSPQERGGDRLVSDNLTKEEFLAANRVALADLITEVNEDLVDRHGSQAHSINVADVWVLTYIEAGLSNGKVDPNHRHSQGERGLLPLPSNIEFWNGPAAPRWDRPMPLRTNLFHFYLYLGQIKNKIVRRAAGIDLYPGLFEFPGIGGNTEHEAKVLAAVVHGYFLDLNYSDGTVPFDHLLSGFARNRALTDIMRPTTYVHAGTSILVGRESNIERAIELL